MKLDHPRASLLGIVAASLFFLLLPASSQAGIGDLFMMSAQEEKQIGQQQHPQIVQEFGGEYDHPELKSYVDRLGQQLAKFSESPGIGYTFTILNSPIVNAFALPGGYVYVTRGLLYLADSEAELAGVLAHEIGHVTARHGAKRQSKGTLANIGLVLAGVLMEDQGQIGGAQQVAGAVLSSHSRDDEFEADTLGVKTLAKAGLQTKGMHRFLRRLQVNSALEAKIAGRKTSEGFDFMATHPPTKDRIKLARETANQLDNDGSAVGRQSYLKRIDGMIFGDDPKQGLIRGRTFVHPELRFRYRVPKKFTLFNGQNSVIARGPNDTQIQFDRANRENNSSMERYITTVWAPDLQLSGLKKLNIHGLPTATARAWVSTDDGRKVPIRLAAIGFDKKAIYRFIFSAPKFTDGLDRAFLATLKSFDHLTKKEAKKVRPKTIALYEIKNGDTVEKIAKKMRVRDHHLDRFLALNGFTRNKKLKPGRQVKIVK